MRSVVNRQRNILFLVVGSVFLWISGTYGALPLDRANHFVTETQDFTVDYGQFDGNRIAAWTGNTGEWISCNVTSNAGLEWPKNSGKTAVFQSGLWIISGQVKEKDSLDFRDEIRTAVVEYASEFQPGQILYFDTLNQVVVPISDYPQEHCIWMAANANDPLNKLYKINKGDTLSSDYTNWPAEQGAPVDEYGKPFFTGDQMLWSVYNDMNPKPHESQFNSKPMGLEIQSTLFGFDRNDPLNNVLFIKNLIINKSDNHYRDIYVGIFADPDIGDATDDYAGVDTLMNMGYAFNGRAEDSEYGLQPPAVGFAFIQNPQIVSPGDTASWSGTPRPGWRETDLSGFIKFKVDPLFAHPDTKEEAYNFVRGLTLTGESLINPVTGKVTRFHLSGDPVTGEGWLDKDDANPGDRWILLSAGPFEMAPCDTQEIVTAIIIAQGSDHVRSVETLRFAKEYAQTLFNSQFDFKTLNMDDRVRPANYNLLPNYPNPFNPVTNIKFSLPEPAQITLNIYDITGRLVEQLVNRHTPAGNHTITWDASSYSSGVYIARLKAGSSIKTQKMVLMK